ncbi:MAG: hypothetical protein J5752_00455 [Clostridiales bacterium]|nr:hypothetical protein [Clostridiales bacterium]
MQTLIEELTARRTQLKKAIELARHQAHDSPDGHLKISYQARKYEYYQALPKDGNLHRIYIPKQNLSLAKALATKDYAANFLRCATRELKLVERYLRELEKACPEKIYARMCNARQALVSPILLPEDILATLWEQQQFKQSDYMPEKKIYLTRKGDMVRSKSEVLFADQYLDLGIPYRYEQVLLLDDGKTVAPDFTIWDKKRKRVVYHEHFGYMDDADYRRKTLIKIDEYRRNGIYTGKNLITTFEGDGAVLNMIEIRKMMEELFL